MEILYSEDYSADSFILNKYNHDAFVSLAAQGLVGYKPYPNILIINGSKFSGKTHLMHIWQKTYYAKFLDALFSMDNVNNKHNTFKDILLRPLSSTQEQMILTDSINSINNIKSSKLAVNYIAKEENCNSDLGSDNKENANPENTKKNTKRVLTQEVLFEYAKKYIRDYNCVLEDIETIEDLILLNLLNMMIESDMQFVLTSNCWPIDIKLKDLSDRLNSMKRVDILQPDLEMLKIIIIRYFRVRSIKIDEKTISYLAYRLPFDLNLVKQILDDINHRSLIEKANISIKFLQRTYSDEFAKII